MKSSHQKYLAEFIGTFGVIFFGCGSIMLGNLPPYIIPVIFGAAVTTMIYTLGHISGAHFNPAVTLAFTLSRHFPIRQLAPYWLAQCAGAVAAVALLSVLMPSAEQFGAAIPTVSTHIALLWEIMLSALLMFVIIAVATGTRAEGMMAGIAIGMIVTLCAYLGGSFTGAAMNPARALAPALFQHTLDSLWLYIVAPCIGTSLGALLYQAIRCEDKKNAHGCC